MQTDSEATKAQHLSRVPRISISQEEITADLIYPARRPAPERGAASRAEASMSTGPAELRLTEDADATDVAKAYAELSPETSRSRTLVWQDPVPTAAAGATMTGMEYMRAVVEAKVPPPPIAVVMRMRPIEIGEGRAVFEGEPGEEHYNPIGVVHGGYAATLLDSALGCAVHTTLRPASATPRSASRRSTCARSRATPAACSARRRSSTAAAGRPPPRRTSTAADSGKLLAHGVATCMILGDA